MEIICQSVGVDVAKDSFVAHIQSLFVDRRTKKLAQRKFKNTASGIKTFIEWLSKKAKSNDLVHIAMEATGRYYEELAYALYESKLKVSVVLPNKVQYFARSKNEYSKTDPIDALMIASYVSANNPSPWQPATPCMRELRELTRERQDLIKMRTQAKNRLHALTHSHQPLGATLKRLGKQIVFFNRQLQQIEEQMNKLRARDEQLAQSVELLTSIPHIGSITAYCILAETDGFTLFDNRNQLIKYAGLDIVEKQSGTSVNGKGKISKRGNANLRSAPYPGTLNMTRTTSVFQQTYQRSIDKGMAPKQARTAVVRQLLRVAFGVYKSGVAYDEQIHRLRTDKKIGEPKSSPTVTHLENQTVFVP